MNLGPDYLKYTMRRHGYDHDLYPWSALHERTPVIWPEQKKVAVWLCVSLEYFPLIPSDQPFRAPGHMQTAYPDYRHYTAREYGTRIGLYRLLDAFAKYDVRASFATNAAIGVRYPEIIADIVAGGHEIIAHSTDMNGTITSDTPLEDERQLIVQSLDILQEITGKRPTGWHSIARSQSWHTPDLLKQAGIHYCCDWVNDELPYHFNNGLINLPLNHELSDRHIITVQQHSIDRYAEQIIDAFDWLSQEADTYGGRLLPLHLTPYIIGLPYRIDGFEKLLAKIVAQPQTWIATGDEIVSQWARQNP